jgi:hypothetical protein
MRTDKTWPKNWQITCQKRPEMAQNWLFLMFFKSIAKKAKRKTPGERKDLAFFVCRMYGNGGILALFMVESA